MLPTTFASTSTFQGNRLGLTPTDARCTTASTPSKKDGAIVANVPVHHWGCRGSGITEEESDVRRKAHTSCPANKAADKT
jgi:hypothetical protein